MHSQKAWLSDNKTRSSATTRKCDAVC